MKYDWHWPDFSETHTCSTNFYKQLLFRISLKFNKNLVTWRRQTDGRADGLKSPQNAFFFDFVKEDQPQHLKATYRNDRCCLSEPHKSYEYILWAEFRIFCGAKYRRT